MTVVSLGAGACSLIFSYFYETLGTVVTPLWPLKSWPTHSSDLSDKELQVCFSLCSACKARKTFRTTFMSFHREISLYQEFPTKCEGNYGPTEVSTAATCWRKWILLHILAPHVWSHCRLFEDTSTNNWSHEENNGRTCIILLELLNDHPESRYITAWCYKNCFEVNWEIFHSSYSAFSLLLYF